MAFEVFTSHMGSGARMGKEECAVDAKGSVRFHGQLFRDLGIGRSAVVLVDKATQRVAFRAPRSDEEEITEPTVAVRWAKTKSHARLSANQAIRDVGVDAATIVDRRPIMVKDGMAIIQFGELASVKRVPKSAKK